MMKKPDQPSYDRSNLRQGIVHIGVGNFHRAHMAVYLDDLFALGRDQDWAILGAGVRPTDAAMRGMLAAQDFRSTVIELDPAGPKARIIGSMTGFVPVEPDNRALIAAMSAASIRIVSLTVTEGGYYIDPATGQFDPSHPDMQADALAPDRPATAFGAIIAALKARKTAGTPPFTVMSCDNLPGNGHVARNAIKGLAALSDPGLAAWIQANVAFPNGMVDRITPATGPRERALAAEFGLDDPAPVTCEPFRQWVLEDHFPAGRPALELVGVTFTPDVHAFETMKIRILNGGHAIIAYPAGLLGIEYVHEAMAHPLIAGFLDKIERAEILPHVPPVPDTELPDYLSLIQSRFANPHIADTVRRLCLDGTNRQPKFIIPTLRDNRAAGTLPEGLILLSALWCRYCFGTTDAGATIDANDPQWSLLQTRSQAARQDPATWLGMAEIYGDLAADKPVLAAFSAALARIWETGTEATLRHYLGA